MGANFDEELLESKTVDPSFGMDVMSQALRIAMYDEFRARAAYTKVVQTFGALAPFINIIEAEERHIQELFSLFSKYGVEPVIDDWLEKTQIKWSFIQNCELGIEAEIQNIQMYDNLIMYAREPDVLDAFYRLQAASYNNHLPAFRKCLESMSDATRYDSSPQGEKLGGFSDIERTLKTFGSAFGAQTQDITALRSIVSSMGTEFILGAAAGVVIVGLIGSRSSNLKEGEYRK